ncbi:hypothetical protein GGX14DRAFT_414128 [Mycena pura]|uniref:Uncharacterized protein n=1 Tax=Mycena pura TaxID=153505 RepID=A0AAD7E4R0_9AGAR|nr:hypothetical protein GGX14DRAFT_414128 [Mycena pura]
MTVRFASYRIAFYVAVFLLSGTVLGLAAHFANIFLPHLHADFTIFALIIPSLTIFALLLSLQFSQPRTEAPMYFVIWALWHSDIISFVQCDTLTTETMPTKNGSIRQRDYCYEMKVIEAFSWMIFVLFSFAFCILLSLVSQAQRFGRPHIWWEPIQELGWFHEMPGYYNQPHQGMYATYPQQYGYQGYPMSQGYMQGAQPLYQIQQGMNGTTVTQVPVVNV